MSHSLMLGKWLREMGLFLEKGFLDNCAVRGWFFSLKHKRIGIMYALIGI